MKNFHNPQRVSSSQTKPCKMWCSTRNSVPDPMCHVEGRYVRSEKKAQNRNSNLHRREQSQTSSGQHIGFGDAICHDETAQQNSEAPRD
ncbi:Methylxanthine N1-demethylase NdmA [Clarias magur]|uniref:Methylxanthine N1-demethylase NdmA n=1 Tax=Clarias magur TaxID=1594786 RepID=A0A8J4UUX9_CLAMG|nr:Methylxanthine N1-demethylase NdmA [Clarias magur]